MVMRRQPENPGSARERWNNRPTARIDWLAGPIAERDGEGREAIETWLDEAKPCAPEAGFARAGYNVWHGDSHGSKIGKAIVTGHQRQPTGERLEWSRTDRTYLVLKGTGLGRMRSSGLDDFDALNRFDAWRGICRRIDLAVDVCHPEVTPSVLSQLFERGHFATRFTERWFGGDPERGETFYLQGKDQTFRAYDKSAERSRKGVRIGSGVTRLELELRGDWAARAAASLLKIQRNAWEQQFPELVCGVILGKVRPLNGKRPAHHPNRAPLFEPLRIALDDIGPVRLPREEELRTAEQTLAGRTQHFNNNAKLLRFMRELLGPAAFDQAVNKQQLDPADNDLLALLQQDPERLRRWLVDSRLLPSDNTNSADASRN